MAAPPPIITDVSDFTAVRDVLRHHGGIFQRTTFFLSKPKRDALAAVLALRTLIHEAIDQPSGHGDSIESRADLFRDRLDEIYTAQLELPQPAFRNPAQHALAAIAHTVRRYEIPAQHFLDLVEARRMDLTVQRYATWNALQRCCDRDAGALGRIVGCILGLRHSDATNQLATLAVAIRLTQILRNVKADSAAGRIYLPLEDLARFGYSERQLAVGELNDRWRALMRFEIARARQLYRRGAGGICWLADDGSRLAVSAVAVAFSGVLDAIERHGDDVFSRPVIVGVQQKLLRLPTIWRLARRREDEPLPGAFADPDSTTSQG